MRRFTLKPGIHQANLSGVGRVSPGQILEGEQFALYVPSVLVELPPVVVSAPRMMTEELAPSQVGRESKPSFKKVYKAAKKEEDVPEVKQPNVIES